MAILLSSCLGSKYLEPGQRILTKQKIKGAKRFEQEEVYRLLEQEPNIRFFRLPFAVEVHLFEWGKNAYDSAKYQRKINKITRRFDKKVLEAKKENKKARFISNRDKKVARWNRKIKEGNWRMRQGAPLAIYDSALHRQTVEKLNQFLVNAGYFDGRTDFEAREKGNNYVHTRYRLRKYDQYTIDSLIYDIKDPEIADIVLGKDYTQALKKGDPYSQDGLTRERERLHTLLLNNGYYGFSRQFIYFEIDTFSLPSPKIVATINIDDPVTKDKHAKYIVDSVAFIGESREGQDEKTRSEYDGITFQFGRNKYDKKLLNSRLFLEPGTLFRQRDANETQQQLANLDAFKFVNINYDTTGGSFVASIFTSPVEKYETSNEVGLSSTAGLPGPFFNVGLKNRNIFRRLELLEINGNLNLQGIGNISGEDRNYSLLQYGGSASLNFPQFLFPLSERLKNKISRFNPRTSLTFTYNFEDRFQEYERQAFNAALSYQWQVRDDFYYTITPASLGFVDSDIEPNSDFQNLLDTLRQSGNGAYPASFESALLSTSSFDGIINKDYGAAGRNSSFLRLFVESGGNFLNIVANSLLGLDSVQYQYLKFRIDYRRQNYIDRNTVLASRIHFGMAYPYGSDPAALPYERYFYIGGSNSIRAWPARRLGPGDFSIFGEANNENQLRNVNYTLEQGGDLIIESSIELRRKITNFLGWAFFIDAGNIWQIQSTPLQPFDERLTTSGRSGLFQLNTFIREIAVGAGVGLRVDLGYLVFRVDGAVQVIDPGQPGGQRFVLDNIDFTSAFRRVKDPDSPEGQKLESEKRFLRNKSRINLGIGFPF